MPSKPTIPLGTKVLFWPGVRRGEGRPSVTTTPVWDVCGTWCVTVADYSGGIALTHIQVLEDAPPGS